MAKTITIDDVRLLKVSLYHTLDGTFHVQAVYHLLSGTGVVKTVTREVEIALHAGQRAALAAGYDQVLEAVKTLEL